MSGILPESRQKSLPKSRQKSGDFAAVGLTAQIQTKSGDFINLDRNVCLNLERNLAIRLNLDRNLRLNLDRILAILLPPA